VERRERNGQKIFEDILAKNSPNLMKNTSLHISVIQQTPSSVNTETQTWTHPDETVESQQKDRILDTAGVKQPLCDQEAH
jgi:hypothetical protein